MGCGKSVAQFMPQGFQINPASFRSHQDIDLIGGLKDKTDALGAFSLFPAQFQGQARNLFRIDAPVSEKRVQFFQLLNRE